MSWGREIKLTSAVPCMRPETVVFHVLRGTKRIRRILGRETFVSPPHYANLRF